MTLSRVNNNSRPGRRCSDKITGKAVGNRYTPIRGRERERERGSEEKGGGERVRWPRIEENEVGQHAKERRTRREREGLRGGEGGERARRVRGVEHTLH